MTREKKVAAGTQYGDWKGTAQADNHDDLTLTKFARDKGWIAADDVIVGWEIYSGEISRVRPAGLVLVTVHFASASSVGEARKSRAKLSVQSVCFEMDLVEFFGKFKRFSVAASQSGEFEDVLADDPVHVK
ncbi:hypothetical protein BOTU111921_10545 [Bordetella tumbae]|uniref:hypothetical protein n=1 Tax=Bordetella tumbae TaxID=1649139 RepID=UPI0039F0E2DF